MSVRIVLSTWSFGAIANAAAWPILSNGGQALDAVEAGCRAVEADPMVQSVGYGGRPDRSGQVSLDASIMLSPSQCGSVCYVRRHMHAATIARLVMQRTQHVMLAGEGADRFAESQGMQPCELLTEKARRAWLDWCKQQEGNTDTTSHYTPDANIEENHDTVGVLALDDHGQLAGACSTSGLAYKAAGRVGDSPIIGHGLFVHPKYGAVVATGSGELVMGVCGSFAAVELMRRGASPLDVITEVLSRVAEEYELHDDHQVGMIALSPEGHWASASLRSGFTTAAHNADGGHLVEPDTVLL
ncbi:N(4)-(beta-N-acetylglucosaminyl)-L-asparaginase [Planctomycetales bacterium ZRK34]|nr:N(4)-(beta-N-acetylglucosaminyl)-L-asparaginase [Planctomycetales bacterium ZRK34]